MSGWSGFTDEELQKLQTEEANDTTKSKASKLDQPAQHRKKREIIPSQKKVKKINPPVMSDCKENNNESNVSEVPIANKCDEPNCITVEKIDSDNSNNIENSSSTSECTSVNSSSDNIGILPDDKASEIVMSSLEKLQLQQKLIEDQNKKKKSMLKEALAERFKQTQSESKKLKEINSQLSHLDELLKADVDILRNKIDEAALEFSQAQRRYESAEKEYVAAKLDYFKKKETKEELTEHLYAIIQENELRKAKKLEELMQKLNSQSDSLPTSPVSTTTVPSLDDKAEGK